MTSQANTYHNENILSTTQKSKLNYEKTLRKSVPVSFNKSKDAELLKLVSLFKFGPWVRHILGSFNPVEIAALKESPDILPASLIEIALDNEQFDLDEYLKAKGMKIVPIPDEKIDTNYAETQDSNLNDFNQEFYY